MRKTSRLGYLAVIFALGMTPTVWADSPAKVTEVVNVVKHGSRSGKVPAEVGTLVHDGEYVQTEGKSRAAVLLPTTSVTRLGSSTIFNYSVAANTIDLEQGTVLFCKPKGAERLNITTAGISAGITGTTGFVSVHEVNGKATYTLGLIEGHAVVVPKGNPPFPIGSGDIVQFTPGTKPFSFAFDLPRFVKSSPLLNGFKGTLPNQAYIDRALEEYASNVSRGFIVPPSNKITYAGPIPVLSMVAYSSAQNANQPRGQAAPPPPPTSPRGPSSFPSH